MPSLHPIFIGIYNGNLEASLPFRTVFIHSVLSYWMVITMPFYKCCKNNVKPRSFCPLTGLTLTGFTTMNWSFPRLLIRLKILYSVRSHFFPKNLSFPLNNRLVFSLRPNLSQFYFLRDHCTDSGQCILGEAGTDAFKSGPTSPIRVQFLLLEATSVWIQSSRRRRILVDLVVLVRPADLCLLSSRVDWWRCLLNESSRRDSHVSE